ncbi:NADPH-dependent FMN reductase [Paenibacillus solisilvae]|uniref:NADPH-dependent FMN reductase n=1 Tax=Paenibacillus solisilvae TaxID=2486751 RepID=A0ABW0VWY8_9BACL
MNLINILTISGSLRAQSSNSALLQGIAALAPGHFRFTDYNGLGDLPHFNPDLDGDGDLPHAAVSDLRAQLKLADAVILCTPEYANGVPGVLKNALDWIVSSGEFVHKPTAVISASPNPLGGDKAHASLLLTLTMMTASIVENGRLMVPFVRSKVSSEGVITDSSTAVACTLMLQSLEQSIHLNKY